MKLSPSVLVYIIANTMALQTIENHMQRGAWDDAIAECRQFLGAQPVNSTVWAYLGVCHFRKSEWEHAVEALKRATILDPKFVDAGVKLAQALHRLGRGLEALEVSEHFLTIRPGDRTLEGLREALHHHSHQRRTDGWERTIRLNSQIIDNSDRKAA